MIDLEFALAFALVIMLGMYFIANRKAKFYKCALVAVGVGDMTIEVDETNRTFVLVPTKQPVSNP